MLKSKPSTPNT